MSLSASGNPSIPPCVKDYAAGSNVIRRVDPVQVGPRYTKVPVRIVIDQKGKVKRVHAINALPEQAKSVQGALAQWQFKPYMRGGRPAEVETGILFRILAQKEWQCAHSCSAIISLYYDRAGKRG